MQIKTVKNVENALKNLPGLCEHKPIMRQICFKAGYLFKVENETMLKSHESDSENLVNLKVCLKV